MLKCLSIAIAAALTAMSLATAAEAGCHGGFGGFGGFFPNPYAYSPPNYSYQPQWPKQQRMVAAKTVPAKPRAIARTVAKSTAIAEATPNKPTVANVASDTTVAKKGDLQTVATVAKSSSSASHEDGEKTVVAQVCRKFSPAVGGLVETACN